MNLNWALSPLVLTALIVVVIAMIQASFQLGVSVLTGLHAHGLGSETRRRDLYNLCLAYVLGVAFITILLVIGATVMMTVLAATETAFWWAVACGIGAGIGVAVMGFYYRTGQGTMLWLPRSASEYLHGRIKRTRTRYEAATLGMSTVLAELPFIAAPLIIIGMLLHGQVSFEGLGFMGLYSFIAVFPLLWILGLVGSGHKIGHIQRWREDNKRFLQFSAGTGLVVVSLYLFSVYGISRGVL